MYQKSTKFWQKCVKTHKCDKKLTKIYKYMTIMWQNSKCIKNLTKIVRKCNKNVSKFKNVFNFCQKPFQKCDKNLSNISVLTEFCHIFVQKMKHFEETFAKKIWQKSDKKGILIQLWHISCVAWETFLIWSFLFRKWNIFPTLLWTVSSYFTWNNLWYVLEDKLLES